MKLFIAKNRKIFKVLVGLIIGLITVVLCLSIIENKNLDYNNNLLKDEIDILEIKYTELDSQYNILLNTNDNKTDDDDANENCEIIKTYEIVEIIEDYSQTGEEVFVVIYEYMGTRLEVVSIDKKYLENIEEGKNYEFYISGYKTENFDIENFDINDIVYTDKNAMDQIQESCS